MKKTLLFTNKKSSTLYCLLVLCLSFNFALGQNLMLNPTCDDWTNTTSDNADAYDMTPNSTIKDNSGIEIPSPYQAIWKNDALEDWLEVYYLGAAGSLDEQPGSTSNGKDGTRGVKLYDDGDPVITGSSRRIYQKVEGLTIGNDYVFSVDSYSEATGTPSEVYILNTEITNEVGINTNGGSDTSVDGFLNITTDYDDWTTSTITFTATNTFVVVYIRSLNSVNTDTEVFYDNFSLMLDETASVEDKLASKFKIFPNPVDDVLTIDSNNIEVSSVKIYDLLGKQVYAQKGLVSKNINVSQLNSGLYLLKLDTNSGSLNKKIIIE
ncbi:T9SS type A sorting domain-containing protein [Seonamhaeicola sp. NFXS20]|uniref:T9SS type A sorting domain-containing protein n=1 Tax=Seonamhaeicola sp. NFXS20 TaxID=2816959 RepID=UPI003B8D5D6E